MALPSAASIEATLHPADSEALYFVATGNGGHKFTNSLAEHNQAVKDYLSVMREKKISNAAAVNNLLIFSQNLSFIECYKVEVALINDIRSYHVSIYAHQRNTVT
ncbi:endolytic transglycosylase MltG [Psychrobacter sp. JCM 18901]|uniref:endolytic transglycosylase MltG n=1 Tax=Psychrobacter sp. JCM 18901 TaxID=1298609 RepID=UPI00351CB045